MLKWHEWGVFILFSMISLIGFKTEGLFQWQNEAVAAAPTANLIAHWRFGEGSLDFITDSSGNGYHGTAVNTNWTSAAEAASLDPYALHFNGSSSYVDTADFDINEDFTITAWIKPNKNDDSAIVMKHDSSGGNLIMLGLYSGKYFFRIREEFYYGPPVHTGEWIHIAVTGYQEVVGPTNIERVALYLNGTLIEENIPMITEVGDISGGRTWTIGQDWDGNTRSDFFDGAIDDVRIYDGELQPSEIQALSQDFTALCRLYPGQEPGLNYAAESGVCDEVILTPGVYNAGDITPANDVLIRGNQTNDTTVNRDGNLGHRFMRNSNHAVTLQNMTIRNGAAIAGAEGGAIYNEATLTLTNVVLMNNTSEGEGGALYNSGHLTLNEVTIQENDSDSTGGGFANAPTGHATLNSVHISDNSGLGGGGIANSGFITITRSLIELNSTNNSGGGILNFGTLLLSGTEIRNNTAVGQGGGLYNDDFSNFVGTATIRRSQFLTNTAAEGGGITNRGTLTLGQSTVAGNIAQNSGGGISNSMLANRIDIHASTISGNQAGGVGAGLDNAADANLINSTISGNQRTNPGDGAGIYSSNAAMSLNHVTITDNASTGTGSINGLLAFDGTLSVTNTLLVDNGSGSINCAFNDTAVTQADSLSDDSSCTGLTVDETVVVMPLADNGGDTLTHALLPGSPAIDAGVANLATDQRGISRPQGATADIGAYELYPCTSQPWLTATAPDLNAAITCYNAVATAGNYTINVSQNISLTVSTAVIDNATAGTSLLLEGNGFTVDGQDIPDVRPFAIANSTAVTINNLTITGGNITDDYGGAIINDGTLTISRSTLSANSAKDGGGIINAGSLTVSNSTLSGNAASSNGGGIFNDNNGSATISNSTLSGNTAGVDGGGIFNDGPLTVNSSTFSANYGGGIVNRGSLTVSNSIIANSSNGGDCVNTGTINDNGNNLIEDNSCGFTGGSDPLLGPLADNGGATRTHALLHGSPAIDSGDTDLITDQRGVSRPQGEADDIGAFEVNITLIFLPLLQK